MESEKITISNKIAEPAILTRIGQTYQLQKYDKHIKFKCLYDVIEFCNNQKIEIINKISLPLFFQNQLTF